MSIVSIDPGEHVGYTYWELETPGRWVPRWAREFTISETEDRVQALAEGGELTKVFYEGFRLKGGQQALQQQGSTFPVVELIGSLRYICRTNDVPFIFVSNADRSAALVRANALKIKWPSHGYGGHAKDAVAVGIAGLKLNAAELRKLA